MQDTLSAARGLLGKVLIKYEEDTTKLYYIENFEIINPKLSELISKKFYLLLRSILIRPQTKKTKQIITEPRKQ